MQRTKGQQPVDLQLTSSLPLRSRLPTVNGPSLSGPTPLKLQLCSRLSLTSSEMRACVHQKSTAPSLSKPASVQALPAGRTNKHLAKSIAAHQPLSGQSRCYSSQVCTSVRQANVLVLLPLLSEWQECGTEGLFPLVTLAFRV